MRVIRCRYEIADELESIIPRDIRRILCESGLPFLPGTGAFSKLEGLEPVNGGAHVAFTDMAYAEGYSGGGLEGIECECCGDGLLECFQGSAVGGVEDSPGLDVGDGALFRPGGSC